MYSFSDIIGWLDKHLNYKIITGICVPVIVAVIGLFKAKQSKNIKTSGDKSNLFSSEKEINNTGSFNTVKNEGNGSVTAVGANTNQVVNVTNNTFYMQDINNLAKTFSDLNYPHAERALQKINLNVDSFLAQLNLQLSHLSQEELNKFSEVDVQAALQDAVRSAARISSSEVHHVLGQLVADRVQKPKLSIAELAINESIQVAAKLDVNLIRMLALSFLFSRTKYQGVTNEEVLIEKLSLISKEFIDLEVSIPRFEYLESISCGKFLQFTSSNLMSYISAGYAQLFRKNISLDKYNEITISEDLKKVCFQQVLDGQYKISSVVGLYLFEDAKITTNGTPFVIQDDTTKEQLRNLFNNNALSEQEKKDQIVNRIPEFEKIIKLWDEKGFNKFSLNAVGIAIGRAYLEQIKIGDFDINTWIN